MKKLKFIIPVLTLSFIVSCGSDNAIKQLAEDKEASSININVTPTQFELSEMQLGSFTNQTFTSKVMANGMLDVPPENKSTVSAYFGGYVKNISLLQGQKIVKGQTLFTLENPDYIQVQQQYLQSKSQLSYLKSDYERQKDLALSNVSSQKTFLKAESDYKVTLANYESLKKKLQLMNINPETVTEFNLKSTIAVKAPISGFVTAVLATKGMFLNPSDIAITIMNTDHMHIELNIFEQDLMKVAVGQEVSFRIQNGKSPYKAVVHLINKAIDAENRSVKVHCHFKSEIEAQDLTPGMYVEATIYTAKDSALALPIDAVISIDDKSYILLLKDQSNDVFNFEKVKVLVGESNQEYIEILNANEFKENAQILVEGAFNLIQ